MLAAGLAVWAYQRGRLRGPQRSSDTWRSLCFAGGLSVILIAVVSPLDALAGALASAHMVQHVLLLLVAAPLLALAAPANMLLRGSPAAVRHGAGRLRRRFRLVRLGPAAIWALHVATIWFWHAAVPYDAALEHHALHVAEHASYLTTGVLFWGVVAGGRRAVSNGLGIMLVFTMAMQSVFLSALLTFASGPWYSSYRTTTQAWNLEPLADQQLAGVIMWIPAGLVYLGFALALLVRWIKAAEREAVPA